MYKKRWAGDCGWLGFPWRGKSNGDYYIKTGVGALPIKNQQVLSAFGILYFLDGYTLFRFCNKTTTWVEHPVDQVEEADECSCSSIDLFNYGCRCRK
jgi:hypothetical protein